MASQGANPAAGAEPVGRYFDAFLCRAWGESDSPCAEIVRDWAGVRRFMVREWLGETEAVDGDGVNTLDRLKADFDEYEKDERGGAYVVGFEIGGVSIERLSGFAPPAASDTAAGAEHWECPDCHKGPKGCKVGHWAIGCRPPTPAKTNPAAGAEPAIAWMRAGANPWHGYEACAEGDGNGFPVYRTPPPATSERDAEDAARYRWLRDAAIKVRGVTPFIALGYDNQGDHKLITGAEADNLIDAQREQSEKRSGEGGK